ncbi:MAG: DUF4276 family protein [Myxococcota bacterium]|jgi:hypothetical protein|nr:DUF4276 family protein [Myxococcota bacterium]
MTVAHVEVLVEEPSAEAALRLLLPRILGDATFAVYPHTCKDELLQRLPERLRGYASWLPKDWRVFVLVDRDDDDCRELKARLEKLAHDAGMKTRSRGGAIQVVNRLAIEELEAWFFGDWEAVRAAFPKVNGNVPKQAQYRVPDAIRGGTWEAFERVLKSAGYFQTGLRKIEAARAVAAYMEPQRNTSASFQALRAALTDMVQT